jgi:hypothetical protein
MATTTNFGWETPDDTDLVKDGAAAIRTALGGVDTSFVDLKGGTTGQVLAKASNTDLDYTWTNGGDITAVTAGTGISGGGTSGDVTITNSMATAITTNGDLIYGTGSGTFTRRGIGSTGQVLTVSGGVPAWATSASTLTIAQVATGTLSGATTTISGLSSYDDIWIQFIGIDPSATAIIFMRLNNNTTAANYVQYGFTNNGSSNAVINPGSGAIRYNPQLDLHATSGNNVGILHLSNCKNAGFTTFDLTTSYDNSSNVITSSNTQGIYKVAEALSSIVLAPSGGSFDGGTYTVFGG